MSEWRNNWSEVQVSACASNITNDQHDSKLFGHIIEIDQCLPAYYTYLEIHVVHDGYNWVGDTIRDTTSGCPSIEASPKCCYQAVVIQITTSQYNSTFPFWKSGH